MTKDQRGGRRRRGRDGYGRFVATSVAGTLVPGVGLIGAGRRRVGGAILGVFLVAVVAVLWYALTVDFDALVRVGSDPATVQRAAIAMVGVAVVWVGVGLVSFVLLEPPNLSPARRLAAAVAVMAAASVVAAPLGMGAQRAFTHRDLLDTVFAADDGKHADSTPKGATDEDPWAGKERVNVLLLGSDSAPNREGARTDSIMVASIDVESGDTELFSLPRNLQYAPLPEGEMREAYPNGFRGAEEAYYWLSSVYRNLPAEFPEIFEEYRDPGAEAMKQVVGTVLDLDIDYYAMVNLDGFEDIVDALGGITMDVPYDIPIGTEQVNGHCTEPLGWVRGGEDKHLDGFDALWVARARCGLGEVSGDYSRMLRQRCVIGAIAEKANPQTLLLNYQSVASAAQNTITTDIPQRRLSAFVELGSRVKDGKLRSLPFTDEIVDYYSPDYDEIQRMVDEALEEPEESSSPDPTKTPTDGPTETPTDDPTETPTNPESEAPDSEGDDESESEDEGPSESDGALSVSEVC